MENAYIYQKLILPADASRQDASNGVRVAYVNIYDMWVKNRGGTSKNVIFSHGPKIYSE